MPEYIELSVDTNQVQASVEQTVQIEITVRNISSIVDVFALSVEGLDHSWQDLSTNSVSLFPRDTARSTLTIKVPDHSNAIAKTYPFSIKAVSRKTSSEEESVPCELTILPDYAFEAQLHPQRVVDTKGTYVLTISNKGNARLPFKLEASDPEGACEYAFDSERPEVPPEQSIEVNVVVSCPEQPLTGQSVFHNFVLNVAPDASDLNPIAVTGVLEVPPKLPRWVIPIGSVVAAVALIAVAAALVIFLPAILQRDNASGDDGTLVDTTFAVIDTGALTAAQKISPEGQPSIVINAVWQNDPDHLTAILVRNDLSCIARPERSDESQPVIIDLKSTTAWQSPCASIGDAQPKLEEGEYAVFLSNSSDVGFQALSVRLKVTLQ